MYTIISLIVLLLSFLLFKRVAGSLSITKLNMVSWVFYYNLVGESFIASVLIVNGIDNHYMVNGVGEVARFQGWLSVQYTMIAMPLGMLFVLWLFGLKRNEHLFESYLQAKVVPLLSAKDSYVRYPLYALSALCASAMIYTLASLKSIPLLGAFKGLDALTLAELRIDSSRGFEGNVYIRNIFATTLSPILAFISYSYWKMSRAVGDMLWFLCMFVVAFLSLTYSIAKSPFIMFLGGFVFMNVLINGHVKRKTLIAFFLIMLILLVLAYILVGKVADPSLLFSYNTGIGGRVLLSQAAGTYLSFEYFPQVIDHIGFHSVSDIISQVTNMPTSERSARLVMEQFSPRRVEIGVGGVLNSLFIAEAWANFGLLGVLIAPLHVGAVIQLLFMLFLTSKKTPLLLGLFTFYSYKSVVTGGFNDYFYNAGSIILIIIFFCVYATGWFMRGGMRRQFI